MSTPTPRAPNQWFGPTGISFGSDKSMNLLWPAIPGKTYRVEYADRLDAEAWTVLGGDVIAATSSLLLIDPAVGILQRFYRIVQVEGGGGPGP
jgi:hypothetical protein